VLLALSGAAVLRVLQITGIARVIPNFTSLDEAVAQAAAGTSTPLVDLDEPR